MCTACCAFSPYFQQLRTLDVEQTGSVYETMMGFCLEVTSGQTLALKPAKAHGASVPVNLNELLTTAPKDRSKWIAERTDYKLPAAVANAVIDAPSIDDLKALKPVLKRLGENPSPDNLLALKVCDPAKGSGAFLVEACRQLAEELVKAWVFHGYRPHIPADEDEVIFARRLVAQRCLYGVDRNPMAVDLAKLSLWLATLAKDHPFTFLDHSLRCGDSLVGLTKKKIESFHWEIEFPAVFSGKKPGFDVIIGNPPFAGRTTLSESSHEAVLSLE